MIDDRQETIHATCVGLTPNAGLLIVGPSGSGKSGLALSLLALGARLVSDDQTCISHRKGLAGVSAQAPKPIAGLIEARGVGILNVLPMARCDIRAIVDLSQVEEERLPPLRKRSLIGVEIPLIYRVDAPHFPAALIQFLKEGRSA